MKLKKNDGSPFKVFTPFWKCAEKNFLDKIPPKQKKIKKTKSKITYFKNCIEPEKNFTSKKMV